MRFLYLLILAAVVVPLAVFAVQNGDPVTVRFLSQSVTFAMSLVVGIAYLLGMVSGSTLVGFLKRSYHRVTDARESQA